MNNPIYIISLVIFVGLGCAISCDNVSSSKQEKPKIKIVETSSISGKEATKEYHKLLKEKINDPTPLNADSSFSIHLTNFKTGKEIKVTKNKLRLLLKKDSIKNKTITVNGYTLIATSQITAQNIGTLGTEYWVRFYSHSQILPPDSTFAFHHNVRMRSYGGAGLDQLISDTHYDEGSPWTQRQASFSTARRIRVSTDSPIRFTLHCDHLVKYYYFGIKVYEKTVTSIAQKTI